MKVIGWKYYYKSNSNNYEYDLHYARSRDGEIVEVIDRDKSDSRIVQIKFLSDNHKCWVIDYELSSTPIKRGMLERIEK